MTDEIEPNPEPSDDHANDRDAELDGVRIRQLAAMRRATYRSRSHAVIATLVCVVAAMQATIYLVQHLLHLGFSWRVLLYAAFVIAGSYGAIFFARRAIALHREATQSRVLEPSSPPDFSTLSDGSQRWKDLEDIR
jgi:hypothetical protein